MMSTERTGLRRDVPFFVHEPDVSFLRHQVQDFVRGDYLRSKYAISNHPYALGGNRVVTQFTQRCNSSRNGDR